jgi:hypothetical protein
MEWIRSEEVSCPYCWESFALMVDTSQGKQEFVEDCPVCCRPIDFRVDCRPGHVESVESGI